MSTIQNATSTHPTTALYSPLNDWQTRILIVYPGTFDQPIKSGLEVINLIYGDGAVLDKSQVKIEYSALSYCWGKPTRDANIICNGLLLPVTRHLFHALRRMRGFHHPLYLWVDAVCINQQDKAEVATQVSMMVSVYIKATVVKVWLGEFERHTGPRARSSKSHYHLDDLARNAWWHRVWVKQEVWAATDIHFYYGGKSITWDELAAWCATPGRGRDNLQSLMRSFLRPSPGVRKTIKDVGDPPNPTFRGQSDQDIVNILRRHAGSRASDVRDHIYGVLGMSSVPIYTAASVNLNSKTGITIDYHKPPTEVFTDVAFYIMERDSCLNLLYLHGTFGGLIDGDRIPSWVPDWRCATDLRDSHRFVTPHNMTRKVFLRTYAQPAIRHGSGLDVRGFVLGTIRKSQKTTDFPTRLRSLHGVKIKSSSRSFLHRKNLRTTIESEHQITDAINERLAEDPSCKDMKLPFSLEGQEWYATWVWKNVVGYYKWNPESKDLDPVSKDPDPVWLSTLYHHRFGDPIGSDYLGIVDIDSIHSQRTEDGSAFRLWLETWLESRTRLNHQNFRGWLYCLKDRAEDVTDQWVPPIWAVPCTSQAGDILVHLRGGTLPVVLRAQVGGGNTYVGHADYLQARELYSLFDVELFPDSEEKVFPRAWAQFFLLQAIVEYNEQQLEPDFLDTFRLR